MSAFVGKTSMIDHFGFSTSKVADPLGITSKSNELISEKTGMKRFKENNPKIVDPLMITNDAKEAQRKDVEGSVGQSLESIRQDRIRSGLISDAIYRNKV